MPENTFFSEGVLWMNWFVHNTYDHCTIDLLFYQNDKFKCNKIDDSIASQTFY